MPATTTLKLEASEHQALVALLHFLAHKISEDEFKAILTAQGRKVKGIPSDRVVEVVADQLVGVVR